MLKRTLTIFLLIPILFLSSSLQAMYIRYGFSTRQGLRRPTMEDTYTAILNFGNNPAHAFFGVFDGHAGKEVAAYTAVHLPQRMLESEEDAHLRIKDAFLRIDQEVCAQELLSKKGTTALTTLIEDNTMYIGWAGDSRAILARNGRLHYATKDHKPNVERRRIEKAGGQMVKCGKIWRLMRPVKVLGTECLMPGISVSRTIGDKIIKDQKPHVLIAEPHIEEFEVQKNDFLILACDGVWDKISNEEAVSIVRKVLCDMKKPGPSWYKGGEEVEEGGSESEKLAARALRDAAIEKGSKDNVSVMVITFDWTFRSFDPSLNSDQVTSSAIEGLPADHLLECEDEKTSIEENYKKNILYELRRLVKTLRLMRDYPDQNFLNTKIKKLQQILDHLQGITKAHWKELISVYLVDIQNKVFSLAKHIDNAQISHIKLDPPYKVSKANFFTIFLTPFYRDIKTMQRELAEKENYDQCNQDMKK